ncbi:hypothetical protein AB1N83_005810 [Pleurotus pulmonarius]
MAHKMHASRPSAMSRKWRRGLGHREYLVPAATYKIPLGPQAGCLSPSLSLSSPTTFFFSIRNQGDDAHCYFMRW